MPENPPEPAARPPRTVGEGRRFVAEHTTPMPVPLVPEVRVRGATEVTPLWHATEAWLARRGIEPPFWAFPWAGGKVLARYVLDTPSLVRRARVLDFACGSGLVAIAACLAGAARVAVIDTDPLALAAAAMNAEDAGVTIETPRDDDARDWVGRDLSACFDVVLAGDVFYDATAAARFLPWFRDLAGRGARVLVGDPGRTYAPREGVRVCFEAEVPVPEGLEGKTRLGARVLEVDAKA